MAIAKAYSHPSVELRHVLWGILYVLGPAAPTEVSLATAKSYLDPAGEAYATPTVTDGAEAVLATIDLAARLAPGGADATPATPPPDCVPAPTGTSATATATEVTDTPEAPDTTGT